MLRRLFFFLLYINVLPAAAQFQGVYTVGFQAGPVNGVTGMTYTMNMDTRNAFQFMAGYTGVFAPNQMETTMVRNEEGAVELQRTMPPGYRNSAVLGGTYQLALLTGSCRSNGNTLYLNIGARVRMHLERNGEFNANTQWITPEGALGLGWSIGLGERWEVFAEANALYYNADDNPATSMQDPEFYQLGHEINAGLRYRILW